MSDSARGAPLFSVRGLEAAFDGRTVLAVDELDIEEGRVTVIVGENGSGKTTLLRLLNGLIAPTAGRIDYRGEPISLGAAAARRMRSETVLVHQAPILFRGTVMQNLLYGLSVRGVSRVESVRRVAAALSRVGLEGLEHRQAAGLSGGQKQRVAIARGFVLEPKVLLLDEPTANVDPDSRALVEAVVREHAAHGATVLLSTHTRELAYRLCDRLLRLENGRIVPGGENIFKGIVAGTDESFTRFATGPVELLCPARQGEFSVAVLPLDDVILSHGPLGSSARNQLRGRVSSIRAEEGLLRVAVDCGIPVMTLITRAAAAELGVERGMECVVTFKASAVRLF
jgi:tungstate transport system ATP-binding protein